MTTPHDPEAIAATLPNMTSAEVRDRLALGQTPARIRAEAGLLAEGLPVLDGLRKAGLLPEAPPLASSAALAFRDHDATLRTFAEQERIDRLEAIRKLAERNPITREAFERSLAEQQQAEAVIDVAQLYELHLHARVGLEKLLRAGAKNEAGALAIYEARLDSTRTHRAWEQAEHDLLGAARYGEAWPERRAKYMRDGVGPHAPPSGPVIPSAYGSADVETDAEATLGAESIFVLQKLAAGDPITREDVDRSVAALARYHEQIKKVVPLELVESEATP